MPVTYAISNATMFATISARREESLFVSTVTSCTPPIGSRYVARGR